MRINTYLLVVLAVLCIATSCNKDEGLGGSSSLEGYVYNVIHKDDNFSFSVDTFPAAKEDVYLLFGKDSYFGEDLETNSHGFYRFDFLRKGTYTVYALSKFADDHHEAVSQTVEVGSGTNKAKNIYIHTGKAYGTSMIKGSVKALYYDKGEKVTEGPAIEKRVYISHYGEDTYFDDVRVGDKGVFIFQKILPGKYEIWVTTEDPDTEKLYAIKKVIEVTETGRMYEIEERFDVIVTV